MLAQEITDQSGAMKFLSRRLNVEVAAPSTIDVPRVFSLDRMFALLAALGDPHLACPVVHVAGSKGKGSVCEMIASGLRASGLGVGLYTSPHLQRINERIRVNDVEIEPSHLAGAIREAALAGAAIERDGDPFTHFELFTAAAFVHFASLAVDIAVIETGLGGLHDATNVVRPVATAITAIQLEHTQILGATLPQIAAAKAGIIKPGVAAFTIPQLPEVHEVLAQHALACKTRLEVVGGETIDYSHRYFVPESKLARTVRAMRVTVRGGSYACDGVAVPYAGEHQAWNCGLALAVLGTLASQGLGVDMARAAAGVSAAPVRGRLEWLRMSDGSSDRCIAIDGAHTPDSVAALLRTVAGTSSHDAMIVVAGIAGDKDVDGILRAIAGGADKAFFSRATEHRRGADPKELLRRYEAIDGGMAQCVPELGPCLEAAFRSSTPRDVIVVAGSYLIAGEARTILDARRGRS
jgi:dihydrofolate synthase/folylpolyglutamate synthase